MQSKNGLVGLQHVPGWTEIYSVVMSKKRALAFLIHVSRSQSPHVLVEAHFRRTFSQRIWKHKSTNPPWLGDGKWRQNCVPTAPPTARRLALDWPLTIPSETPRIYDGLHPEELPCQLVMSSLHLFALSNQKQTKNL
jgi:hypothetical protein